jgi:hypothetical protein
MSNTFQISFAYEDDDTVFYSCPITCNMSEETFNNLFNESLDNVFTGDLPELDDLGAIAHVFDQDELDDITLNDFQHNGRLMPHNVFLLMCKCVQLMSPSSTFEIGEVESKYYE